MWPSPSPLSSPGLHCTQRIATTLLTHYGSQSSGQCLDCSRFPTNTTLCFANAEEIPQKGPIPSPSSWKPTNFFDFCFVFLMSLHNIHSFENQKQCSPLERLASTFAISSLFMPLCLCEELFLFLSYPLAEVPNGALVFIIRKEGKIICQTPWWSYLVENLLTVKWYHIKEGRKNFKLSISAQKKSVCLRGDSITPHHQIKRPWGNGNFHELLRGVQKTSWMPFCFIFFQTYSFLSRRNPPNVFWIHD